MQDPTRRHLMLRSGHQDGAAPRCPHTTFIFRKAPRVLRLAQPGTEDRARSVCVWRKIPSSSSLLFAPKHQALHRHCQDTSQEGPLLSSSCPSKLARALSTLPRTWQRGAFCRTTAKTVHTSVAGIHLGSVQDVHRTAPTIHRLWKQTRHKSQRVHSSATTSQCSALTAVLQILQLPRCTICQSALPGRQWQSQVRITVCVFF